MTRASGPSQWGPLAAGLSIYLGLTGLLLFLGMQQTAGTFVDAQDDPYIHLTVARTLAEHGVWEIRPDQFASASSSPLWTMLLATLWKLGAHAVWWPLVVNIACGVAVLGLIDAIVRDSIAPSTRAMLLAAVVVITPLPTLALVGMEHTLQVLLSVALAWQIVLVLDGADNAGIGTACLLAVVLTATRYEGLFIVAAGAALFAVRRRFGLAAILVLAAALPVIAFAVYSVSHGALVLPNSILMKSQPARFGSLGEGVTAVLTDWTTIFNLFSRPPELALTVSVLLLLARIPALKVPALGRPVLLGSLFTLAMLLHACLVKVEWFYRYEAALVSMGVLALAWIVAQDAPREALIAPLLKSSAGGALVGLLLLPLATRSLSALAVTPGAMRNVYEQQYQMARFFSTAYPADTVALNDIGAVAWLSSSGIVDVYGLATQEVADLKRRRQWNEASLEALIARRQVRAIAIYDRVFAPIIPGSWTLVGRWQIAGNVGVSDDTVGFFVAAPGDVKRLRAALDAFAPGLPATVRYTAVGK